MQAELRPWQVYLKQVKSGIQRIAHNDTADAASQVFNTALQLTKLRCSLGDADIDIWQQADLPAAITQTEILWQLASQKHWPAKIKQHLVLSGFCAALSPMTSAVKQWPRLQTFPALLAAKLLIDLPEAKPIWSLLNACYATERNVPTWYQTALSIMLTVSEHLTQQGQRIGDMVGRRIALSRSEEELSLLRLLIVLSTQHSAISGDSDFIDQIQQHSRFYQLQQANVRQQEQYLQQSPALSQPILQLASKLNRQQQVVTELRLALNILGQDRWPGLLAEAELNYALAQRCHPLHHVLRQFTVTFGCAWQLLQPADVTDTASRALSLCVSAPLWLNHHLWFYSPRNLNAISKLAFAALSTSANTILALLQHYQFTDSLPAVKQWLDNSTLQTTEQPQHVAALQLAFHSSLQLLTGNPSPLTTNAFAQARQLGLLTCTEQEWLLQLATGTHSYCPLELTL